MCKETEQGWMLIVGLGNPGRKYAQNRHNAGFHCLDSLAEAYHMSFDTKRDKAEVALGRVAGRRVVLAKPQTFMNDSGAAVGALARFYKVEPAHVLVVYDDLDLPLGRIRIRAGGGSAGHRGMESIITSLGTDGIARLRIGIGRADGEPPEEYVLENFSPEQSFTIEAAYEKAVAATVCFVEAGVDAAMNDYN